MSWENAKDKKPDVLLSDWQQIQFRKQWAFVGCCTQFIFNRNKHDHFIRILPFLADHNPIKYAWDCWHFFFHNHILHKYARTLKYYCYSFEDWWTSVEQANGVGNMYANTCISFIYVWFLAQLQFFLAAHFVFFFLCCCRLMCASYVTYKSIKLGGYRK